MEGTGTAYWRRRRLLKAAGALGAAIVTMAPELASRLMPGEAWAGVAWAAPLNSLAPTDPPLPARDIGFKDLSGADRRLADYRGRTVLLNFWATWCVPCVKEMPELVELQKRIGPERLTVLALSQDRLDPAKVQAFVDKHGLGSLTIMQDRTGDSGRAYGIRGLPTSVVLDAEGREIARAEGVPEWLGEAARKAMMF